MKYVLISMLLIIVNEIGLAQSCPTIDKRNNGNGQAKLCAGVDGTPVASNFIGTDYATAPEGVAKTGDITFVFDEPISSPPAIKRIWIGNVISNVMAGPASVPEVSGNTTIVKYCFYDGNLPPAASFTLEFVDPQTDSVIMICGYSGSDNSSVLPPKILTQPLSQSSCIGEALNLSVVAESTNGGSLNYQWQKDGVDIPNATNSTLIIDPISLADSGSYACLVGESTGTFVISEPAWVNTIDCSNNLYFNECSPTEITESATNSWNNAWTDYNGDGWEDLYVTDKDLTTSSSLYENNNATLNIVSSGELVTTQYHSASSAWADIDNDGDIDVCIVNATGSPSLIYLNNGNGTFTELINSGIDTNPQYFHGAAWADFDNDGYVDLILTNFFETRNHHLYKNNHNNTFTKVENTPVTQSSNRSTAPLLADYNNDGLVDIFIPNGNNKGNSLFKNIGNFQFEAVTSGSIVTDLHNSVGGAWGDYNGDGYLDLFVANASNQNNALYTNNGDGTFTRVTNSIVVNDQGHSHGANWMDIDNDGDLDLFVTNDNGPNFLYINDGTGNFSKVEDEALATDLGLNYGQAWADYNKDGFLDVMLSFHSNQNDRLYCNKTNANHWINIKLEGVVSNADGIGAQIRIKSGGEWQIREINPISGFGSQNSIRSHFGLGEALSIDSIEVRWPSGIVQYVTNQASDEFITIVEETASNVSGLVFHDANGNCILDEDEILLSNIGLIIEEESKIMASDSSGSYNVYLTPDSYNISLTDNSYWQLVCPSTIEAVENTSFNVPLQPVSSGYDLTVDYSSTAWRRGFTAESVIQYSNLATTTAVNSTITVTYPSTVTILGANIEYYVSGENQITFELGDIAPGETGSIIITDSVTLESTVGDELIVTTTISANDTDLNNSNNTSVEVNTVVGAIDPNDILVTPTGVGEDNFISKIDQLTYKIRFQNVGTYYASRVYLECRLSEHLDLSSFVVANSSHDYTYSIDKFRVLRVNYNGIYLPDSTTDEKGSHGFFKFSIYPKSDLSGGERIEEKALIAFDYEDPLRTNQVFNTIKYNNPRQRYTLGTYPNPAKNFLKLELINQSLEFEYDQSIQRIEAVTPTGQILKFNPSNSNKFLDISISDWPEGIYFFRVYDHNNNFYSGKVLIRH